MRRHRGDRTSATPGSVWRITVAIAADGAAAWPDHVELDTREPTSYGCSGSTPTRRFESSQNGRSCVAHVALGERSSDDVRTLVEEALSSFVAEPA